MNIGTHEIDVCNNLVYRAGPILSGFFMMVYAGRYSTGLVFIKVQSDLMFALNGLNNLWPKTTAEKKEEKKNLSRGNGELNSVLKLY